MHADTITACENCGTALQGQYCHACGQSSHNPLKHVSHAVEEVFESFWHLDGRALRTLRDLLVPGRVACNYLAGQRVRYIPPLRLFLVLTLLTFFVGRLLFSGADGSNAVHVDTGGNVNLGQQVGVEKNAFAKATTEAEVLRQRDKTLAALAEGRRDVGLVPGAAKAMRVAEAKAISDADQRIAELRRARGETAKTPATPKKQGVNVDLSADEDADPDVSIDKFLRRMSSAHLKNPQARWNATTNPADIGWLPTMGDHWFNHKLEVVGGNAKRFSKGEGDFVKAWVAAMPTALFAMMPLFALMLRLMYLRRAHGVLEHLVVALYSHAFLLLALIVIFVLSSIGAALVPAVGWIFYVAMTAAIVYIPVYLLLMQKRVYGQGWPKTIVKYVLIGGAYQFLLVMATTFAALLPFLGGE